MGNRPHGKEGVPFAKRSVPVGYAAEYLIPSLSDVLATIALPHSVTYLLRDVNGLWIFPKLTIPHPITRYVTYHKCRLRKS